MPDYLLALDQGTTGSRAIIFDRQGAIRSVAQKEFTQFFPDHGWVEHDAAEIWSSQLAVCTEAIAKAGIRNNELHAIGITNQRETTVVWDRHTHQPVCPAIVWQDRRTAAYCDELRQQGRTAMIREKTGLVPDAYFSATKIRWILEQVPGAREKARNGELCFGTVDSWLVWKLTRGAVHVTDVSNASRTMLYNIHTLQWDTELLDLFGIPWSMLPEVRSSSEVYGHTDNIITSASIPVAGIAGDQQAALFGQMCLEPGMVKNTYGTGCFMLMNTGEKPVRSENNLLTTIAWKFDGRVTYALEGSVFIGGAVVQWLRDGLRLIQRSSEVEGLAARVHDNGGVYLVPAFTGLGAPYWDPHARGMIVGLTRGSTNAHLARAALESIAYQSMDLLNAMQQDAGIAIRELRVDGGATVNDELMQFQCDMAGARLVRPVITETTAMGAAFLAGLATGFWSSVEQLREYWKPDRVFTSSMEPVSREQLQRGWKRAVRAARAWSDES